MKSQKPIDWISKTALDAAAVTRKLDAVYARVNSQLDPDLACAALEALRRTEW